MHNMSVMHLPVWLLCFVYPMCVSCTECGEKKGLEKCELQHTEEETVCNITISHRSASYLMIMFNKIHPDVAHFKLQFPESSAVNAKEEAIQPFRWVWTFASEDMKVPFLHWGLDYATLSFGLLNAKALPETSVEFDVQPLNCSITIGNRKSNLEIAYAFSNMTNKYFNSLDFDCNDDHVDNRNHSWCFVSEHPLFKGSYQYNCCYSYYDFVNEEINVNCSDDWIHDNSRSYSLFVTLILILGYIMFCYFPIPLLDIVSNMSGKTLHNGYSSLNDDLDDSTSDSVYLDKQSPISFSSIIYESFYKRHPQVFSRLYGILFILFFPSLIYLELVLYSCYMQETILELIKHGTTTRILTMLGGFASSSGPVIDIIFEPYVMIMVFYVFGIVLVIRQETIGKVLEDALLHPILVDKHVLFLGYDSLQLYSHVIIEEKCVYSRLKSVMLARCFCILNPKFWRYVWRCSFEKRIECVTGSITKLPMLFYYFLLLMILPILLLIFIIEFSACCIAYGLPFVFLFFLALRGFLTSWFNWLISFFATMKEKIGGFIRNVVVFLLVVLAFLFYCYISMTILLIFSDSMNFILRIFLFVMFAVLVYPSTALVHVSFAVVLLYYFFKQIRSVGDTYLDLLSDIVKSLKELDADSNELRVAVTYKNRVPGIPRELFLHVVQKHRPIFIYVFKSLLPIGLICMLMPGIIQITSLTSNDSSTVTKVMNVIFIVVIGALPQAVETAFADSNNPALKKEIFQKKLETTILEYNKSLVELQSLNCPGVEIDLPV